jgi:hypothetical protein
MTGPGTPTSPKPQSMTSRGTVFLGLGDGADVPGPVEVSTATPGR